MNPLNWCIFCRVVDNYGDAGVCTRLARELALRGHSVELWIDQPEILTWMAPEIAPNIKVIPWYLEHLETNPGLKHNSMDVIIEAFGCEIPSHLKEMIAEQVVKGKQLTQWINLEYLSGEAYAERNHGLMSPLLSGPGAGAHKWFFYPGFTSHTGGLLLEKSIRQRIKLNAKIKSDDQLLRIGLFCYPDAPLEQLLREIGGEERKFNPKPVICIPKGEAQDLMKQLVSNTNNNGGANLADTKLSFLDALTQDQFDDMLWRNDLNFVRGEDSLIRAIWVGKPWIWQIYKQSDNAHFTKLNALLDLLECPLFVKEIHWGWNKYENYTFILPSQFDIEKWSIWRQWCIKIRSNLLEQADLVTQLMNFVDEKRQKTVES